MKTKLLLVMSFLFITCSHQRTDDLNRLPASENNGDDPKVGRSIDDAVDIPRHYDDHEGMMTCQYAQLLQDEVEGMTDEELKKAYARDLEDAKADFQNRKGEMTFQTRRLKKRVIKDLELLLESNEPRTLVQKTLASACEVARIGGGASVRTTALTASTITAAMSVPLRFVYRFGRGLITGVPDAKKAEGFYEKYGFKIGSSVPSSLAYRGLKTVIFAGASPYLLPLYLSPMIDFYAQKVCVEVNELNPNEKKFCNNLKKIKTVSNKSVDKADDYGAKFNRFLDKKINFRGDDEQNLRLCKRGVDKQIKVATRIVKRALPELQEKYKGLKNLIVLPPGPNSCVKLGVVVENDEELAKIGFELGFIMDGMELLYEVESKTNFAEFFKTRLGQDEMDVCLILNEQKARSNPEGKKEQSEQLMGLLFNPGKYAPADAKAYPVKAESLVSMPITANGELKNIIFVIGPSREQREEWDLLKPAYEALNEELKDQQKILRKLYKKHNYEACKEKLEKEHFDFAHYKEIKKSLAQFKLSDLMTQNDALVKQLKQTTRNLVGMQKTKLHWEIANVNNMREIHQSLHDQNVGNILIVAHGETNGKIVDSNHDEVPSTFFKWISPSIMSVNFYSCHSGKGTEVYGFTDLMQNEPSYHQQRYSYFLGENDFLGESELAPIMAFGTFLESIDKKLQVAMKDNVRYQTIHRHELKPAPVQEICQMKFENFVVKEGSFGVTLNRKFVGLKREKETLNSFSFPCAWLTDPSTVLIEGRHFGATSTLDNLDFNQVIIGPGWTKTPKNIKHFTGSEGQYISTKISY